jgi:cytochrome c-type biogenesis protein CcmH/NrfF
MDDCTPFFHQMADLRSHRLADQEQVELFTHLARCASCRELLDFHDDLSAAAVDSSGPSDEDLSAMRGRVLAEIGGQTTHRVGQVVALQRPFWWRPQLLAAAASVLILLAGFALGRNIDRRSISEAELLASLGSRALQNTRLQDVEDSPTLISNVAVRPLDNGRIALAFDVARHLEVQRDESDPLVNEILVHAMLDQSSLGSRLKAVSLASTASNGKVQEALIFAMVDDPDLPVRLRALEILTRGSFGAAIEEGLFQVLKNDDSVQMRLLAVERLAQSEAAQQRLLEELRNGDGSLPPALSTALQSINQS